MTNWIDLVLQIVAGGLKVTDKLLPSEKSKEELFKERFPLRFERIAKKTMKEKLRKLRILNRFAQNNGIPPELLAQYIAGELTTAEILELKNKKP